MAGFNRNKEGKKNPSIQQTRATKGKKHSTGVIISPEFQPRRLNYKFLVIKKTLRVIWYMYGILSCYFVQIITQHILGIELHLIVITSKQGAGKAGKEGGRSR